MTNYRIIFTLLCCLSFIGCGDGDDEPSGGPKPALSMTIASSGANSVTLNMKRTNATSVKIIYKATGVITSETAQSVAQNGTQYTGTTVEIDGLAAQTTYTVFAVACNDSGEYSQMQYVRFTTDAPGPRATVEAVKDVMRFWLDMGCDGFRVDMASSLVKNDTHHKKYTCAIWRDIAAMLDKEYPEAALVSEWNQPRQSLKNGFDMDFMLEWQGNGYSWLMRNYDGAIDSDPHNIGKAYFCADSGTGIDKFLDDWLPSYKATRKDGLYCLITCNHDTIRPSAGLTPDELKIAYAMLFTLPGAPFVYYGDEIGMRYLPLPTKEGGYFRTGSRTPMQWDNSANKGFSTAAADKLYLPVDDAADAPTVAAQQADPDSLWHTVQGVLNFRHSHRDLDSDAPFHVRFAPKAKGSYRPFAWERGKLICAVNPAREEAELPLKLEDGTRVLHVIGKAEVKGDELVLGAQSFAILG